MKYVLLLLTLLLISGCSQQTVVIKGTTIAVEIADTPEERALGLMNRTSLCAPCGMLFIFEQEAPQTFWMKNTLIPLDMIFINKEYEIVNITEAEPCTADHCPLYPSSVPAQYVLEVNKGFSNAHQIAIGEYVTFNI